MNIYNAMAALVADENARAKDQADDLWRFNREDCDFEFFSDVTEGWIAADPIVGTESLKVFYLNDRPLLPAMLPERDEEDAEPLYAPTVPKSPLDISSTFECLCALVHIIEVLAHDYNQRKQG